MSQDQGSRYSPPGYLRNAHLQTIFNSQGLRKLRARRLQKSFETVNLVLQADDGTRLLADLDRSRAGNNGLVVLLHGWEGSSQSAYLVTTAARLLREGYDTLRVNLRDHGDSHHLNPELFNSTRSAEVASAIENFVSDHACPKIFIAGFSLGGSFGLRIAADSGEAIGLSCAVAISPPIDPSHAMDALNQGFFAYERYFFDRWYRSLQRKLEAFPELAYQDDLAVSHSLDDLNRLFIPKFTPYDKLSDYFAAYALTGDRLAGLAMPAHLIAASDDPIIPVSDLDRINAGANLHIERYDFGGHCGFLQNLLGDSWVEDRLLEILRAF
ncbi:MAG: alpha/beta fold hydrolase [Pseudomonadota bacterium]